MNDCSQVQSSEGSFGNLFNLHPLDAVSFLQSICRHLQSFTQGFKQRIEIEIEYSKSLIRVSKHLNKHINPQKPSPLSYLSSAFKVEQQQRARHALELAQYLHSQIEVPCQHLFQQTEGILKQLEKQLRKSYKEGEVVEQVYQKSLKKYFRSKQDWEERMMDKIILSYVPGVSNNQLEKAKSKLQEQRQENQNLQKKYLNSLDSFNKFGQKYNESIESVMRSIQGQCLNQLSLQADSIRKLIVSEVSMFKNIQYDLLNISRQMELINPSEQLLLFTKEFGLAFNAPIISIYADGPIVDNGYQNIDYKFPIFRTLLEQTLLNIEKNHFSWMLDNKHNSTLRYCLQQAWAKFEGLEAEEFMTQLQECIVKNKVVESIPINNGTGKDYLNRDEVFSISFSIICTLGSFIRCIPLSQNKQMETIQLLSNYISIHHFYRFITVIALEELLNSRSNQLTDPVELHRLLLVLRLLIQESFSFKDIFVLRSVLTILFSTSNQLPLYLHSSVKELDFWNSDDFWQAVLFEGTLEEISLLPPVIKSELREIYLMRQKNIMFSALATYCHYMAMIGCQHSQVHSIAARFSHIYGLYQQHQKDLSKMIKKSTEKYAKMVVETKQKSISFASSMSSSQPVAVQDSKLQEKEQQVKQSKGLDYLQQIKMKIQNASIINPPIAEGNQNSTQLTSSILKQQPLNLNATQLIIQKLENKSQSQTQIINQTGAQKVKIDLLKQ